MPVHIQNVLTPDELMECRALLDAGQWVDGRDTAGAQAIHVKKNQQLNTKCEESTAARQIIAGALSRNLLLRSVALPRMIFPPMFNRYEGGMTYGAHVDNSVQVIPDVPGQMMRADLSATLFLTDPDDYEGGDLTLETNAGTEVIRLPAGDMIVYPTTMIHAVTPVTRGCRIASFFWIQSLVPDPSCRTLLFDLDRAIIDLSSRTEAGDPAVLSLTGTYHNLLRKWCLI
ncbi:Fe2+-dependent dioxygenase [Acetobacter fallax]|uniref:Fe2+-dependent dioxygenase n=1 Tax=Acetobacter fallax TaxID=1737473 RepID=A0ABX0K8U4_9PROT|nr:Fe2+-dependent dioxygenase [Acetobacter fallax]NHO32815.1 Fe2+-dependent dioxygenase [Acetobacter fallax]NHO36401.1 Fe2+-dependent dioxygenase [Acetobacter fallax]